MGLLHKAITEAILKAFFEVYNELGPGFLESVYGNALGVVFADNGVKAEAEKQIKVVFRGKDIGDFRADFLVEDKVIVELKVAKALDEIHEAQLLNYLKATESEVGPLLNFGKKPEFKRLVFENQRKGKRISDNPRKSAV